MCMVLSYLHKDFLCGWMCPMMSPHLVIEQTLLDLFYFFFWVQHTQRCIYSGILWKWTCCLAVFYLIKGVWASRGHAKCPCFCWSYLPFFNWSVFIFWISQGWQVQEPLPCGHFHGTIAVALPVGLTAKPKLPYFEIPFAISVKTSITF